MAPEERRRFLVLLEGDARLGRGRFYCHGCNALHPFQRDWGPRSEREARAAAAASAPAPTPAPAPAPARPRRCGVRDGFAPAGNPFGLAYHAHLAVNHHLYGPGRGLPLANICVGHTERRPAAAVRCSTDARILDGELFLRRTYAFAVADAAVAEFCRGAGPHDFRLCQHTCFFPHSSSP